jgi:pimeloyl-ACP methyl ester carboxylesterase
MGLGVAGTKVSVILPTGYPAPKPLAAHVSGNRIRFALPGRPAPVAFDGTVGGPSLHGTVSQGSLRGRFALRRGAVPDTGALGVYRARGETLSVTEPGSPTRLLVGYEAARIHGLYRRTATDWDVGSGLGVRRPVAGRARFSANAVAFTVDGVRAAARRVPVDEWLVRFRSGDAFLAGTLTVPRGRGTHPAVAFVHGSGPTDRSDAAVLSSYFVGLGFAVLNYDKRGIGLSGGAYPGEAPTTNSVAAYARDAQAAARFLAAQPAIDRARVGLAGSSQAGWIMPLAASREPAVRFLVAVSGPTVTTGEQGTYQDLTTEGARIPDLPHAEIIAAVRRAGRSGFDPVPSIARLRIPALWVYGSIDQHVPTELCLERLRPFAGDGEHDFEIVELASADHFLLLTEHALQTEELRTSHYAPDAFASIGGWLAKHGLR